MAFKDLREFIDVLEREGELQRVRTEVHWNLEIGAACRLSNEIGGPALFFFFF